MVQYIFMTNSNLVNAFDPAALIGEFEENTLDLLQTINVFSNEEFNTRPFEGSWTAGQVAEHLFKSESGIPFVLKGRKLPANRNVDEKMEQLRGIFLDFTTKLNAPDFIIPTNDPKEKEFFLKAFEKNRHELKQLFGNIDMSQLMMEVPFPQLNHLTGWEWICFLVCHTNRHIRQIKNIYSLINKK